MIFFEKIRFFPALLDMLLTDEVVLHFLEHGLHVLRRQSLASHQTAQVAEDTEATATTTTTLDVSCHCSALHRHTHCKGPKEDFYSNPTYF